MDNSSNGTGMSERERESVLDCKLKGIDWDGKTSIQSLEFDLMALSKKEKRTLMDFLLQDSGKSVVPTDDYNCQYSICNQHTDSAVCNPYVLLKALHPSSSV